MAKSFEEKVADVLAHVLRLAVHKTAMNRWGMRWIGDGKTQPLGFYELGYLKLTKQDVFIENSAWSAITKYCGVEVDKGKYALFDLGIVYRQCFGRLGGPIQGRETHNKATSRISAVNGKDYTGVWIRVPKARAFITKHWVEPDKEMNPQDLLDKVIEERRDKRGWKGGPPVPDQRASITATIDQRRRQPQAASHDDEGEGGQVDAVERAQAVIAVDAWRQRAKERDYWKAVADEQTDLNRSLRARINKMEEVNGRLRAMLKNHAPLVEARDLLAGVVKYMEDIKQREEELQQEEANESDSSSE
jgi:hypothetical protein